MSGRRSAGRRLAWALGTLVGVALTSSLGLWQLDRAAQKQELQRQIDTRAALPPLSNTDLVQLLRAGQAVAPAPEWPHRPVELRGQWLPEKTLFLDNRQMEGKPGFFVLTPLRLAAAPADAPLVLVQRGWAPRDFMDRQRLPRIDTPTGEVTVVGRMAPWPAQLYEFEAGDTGRIRQNVAVDSLASEWGAALWPLSVLQTEPAGAQPADGLSRRWPRINTGVDKHYGYAFQWFGLAALMVILYVWFQFFRRR